MVNYKNVRKIVVGGRETFLKSTDNPVNLTEQTQGATAADAMQKDSGVYSVPAGKEFVGLGVKVWTDGTGGGSVAIWSGDTEDAKTAVKKTVDIPFVPLGMAMEQFHVATYIIAASKFITIQATATVVLHFEIIGFERDV